MTRRNTLDATQDAQTAAPATQQPDGTERPADLSRRIPSDAEVARRRKAYAKYLPLHPLRASSVPPPLAHLSEFVECADERAAVFAAQERIAQARREHAERQEAAEQAHHDAQRSAMLDGTPPPPPFVPEPWPYPQHDLHVFQELHIVIEAKEAALLDERAQEWRAVLQADADRLRQQLDEARAVVAALQAEAEPYEAALARLDGDRYVDDRIVPTTAVEPLSEAERREHERIRATFGQRESVGRLRGRR